MRIVGASLLLGIVALACPAPPPPPPPPPTTTSPEAWPPPDEQALVDAAAQPVLAGGWVQGLVVGVADAAGPRVYGYGGLDGNSLIELGSTTEVFTGLLFAEAVQRGAVQPDNPVRQFLPPEVPFPETITLQQLAIHTSGLPRLPDNLAPADPANPFADYTLAQLHEFLGLYQPTGTPGETFALSNVGTALLAQIVAPDYEANLVERVLDPLGMQRTRVGLDGLAQGHDGDLNPVVPWTFDALVGAGGLRSTTNDLVAFLGASLGFIPSTITPLLQAAQGKQSDQMALGWHLMDDGTTLWHNGQTGGYHSFLALDPQRGMGVVVLSDTSTAVVDDVGLVVLGKLDAPRLAPTMDLSTFVLDLHVGRYRLERGVYLEVQRDGDHLVLLSPGEAPARLYAASEIEFYMRVSDVRVTFSEEKMVLHRADGDVTARRARH